MKRAAPAPVAKLLGSIPHRLQLAGGWIDQPFVSRYNAKPPGSMVVVQIEPDFPPMDRAGIELSVWRIHRKIGMSGGLLANAMLRETGRAVTPEDATNNPIRTVTKELKTRVDQAIRQPPTMLVNPATMERA